MNNGSKLDLEAKLMQAFKQGNRKAFTAIFNHFHPDLFYFADRLIKNREEAEEIVSDIFVKLFQRHDAFELSTNIKAFLYISTRNACINWIKSEKRRLDSANESDKIYDIPEPSSGYIDRAAYEAKLISLIKEKIEKFPRMCKKVFNMHHIEGKKQIEIAKELGISESAVSAHLKTAKAKLNELISPDNLLILTIFMINLLNN